MDLAPVFRRRIGTAVGSDDDVQGTGFQLVQQAVAGAGFQKEAAALQILRESSEQAGGDVAVEILDHAEAEGGEAGEVGHRQFGPRFRGGVEDGLGVATEHRPGGRHLDRAAGTVEKGGPEGGFQRSQLLADRRGRDAKAAGGGGNRSLFRGGDEDLDPPERDAAFGFGHFRAWRVSSATRPVAA